VILGLRGSGKTTFLRLLCGMEIPTEGRIDREMSVSLPVGYNGRVHNKTLVSQFLRFAARIHGVEASDLIKFVLQASGLPTDSKQEIGKLRPTDRRRMNYVLSYALPFDCYLFDENIGLRSREDVKLFTGLYEARHASTATIIATSSAKTAQIFCERGAALYLLYNGHLIAYEDFRDAVYDFRKLSHSFLARNSEQE
jgi:capsular polysaccharide transport system ATP-binding protein